MSLRNYLFILIGCLICLLTITQLVIVHWIENNLANEVDFQARHYSDQVIELAVEKLDNNQKPTVIISHSVEDDDVQIIKKNIDANSAEGKKIIADIERKIANEVNPNEKASTSENTADVTRQTLTKEFKALVNNIYDEKSKILKQKVTKGDPNSSPNTIKHTWIESTSVSPSSQLLFEKIQLTLILVGILGLVFAYWLSTKFNKPLKQLTQGFTLIEKGEYQIQVHEDGVKEIKETIRHFNNMVVRLSQLSKAEKQHKEIAHLAELGEVSRGLAHALRNPIHTISLSIEQLSDEALTQKQRNNLINTIHNKIENIDKNIKALLSLTSNGLCRDEDIPLLAVIQDIVLEAKSYARVPINFSIDIAKNLKITGAESEIRSILHTLIINACEASDANATVGISAKVEIDSLIVSVKDNGNGIDKHIENQLFQPHVSSKPEGAGMGLYIAKRLITLHYQGSLILQNITNNQHEIKGCCAIASFHLPEKQLNNSDKST